MTLRDCIMGIYAVEQVTGHEFFTETAHQTSEHVMQVALIGGIGFLSMVAISRRATPTDWTFLVGQLLPLQFVESPAARDHISYDDAARTRTSFLVARPGPSQP
jgi:hypothetical protein